jgi:uncharacterized protein (DUF1499 family)
VILAWTFGIAAAFIYGVAQYVPAAGWYINDVTTGKTPEYPELQSRVYDSSPENTTVFAAAAASRLPGWKVIRTDPAAHVVICEVKTPLGLFTDDVTVRIEPFGPVRETSRVEIRSHSRVGRADLGQNARHIQELQEAMDDKLPRLSP